MLKHRSFGRALQRIFHWTKVTRAFAPLPFVKQQLDAYSKFLGSVAALARSNWTEFNLKLMGLGFFILFSSLYLHLFLIRRLDKQCGLHSCYSREFFGVTFACILVLIRACSFLSNSFILEEGRVASFLWQQLQYINYVCNSKEDNVTRSRISIELGQLKQAVNSLFLKVDPSRTLGIDNDSQLWMDRAQNLEECTVVKVLALLSAWSSTIIILSGKQGPLVALASSIGGACSALLCLIRLMALEQDTGNESSRSSLSYALPVAQWSLLAVCMFFSTGHWCAFDGLRYAAAFIG
ncbi:UNVERIFIED_CONTAM: hypothetical protein Sradi_3544900, partial [Sesamum radiatum]